MKYYPILIPIKQYSRRCPGKNNMLLPILHKSLSMAGVVDKCVVLCDSKEIASVAGRLGFNTWCEPEYNIYKRNSDNSIENVFMSCCKSEFESMNQWKLHYMSLSEEERKRAYNGVEFDTSYCFLAPVTQPFKSMNFYNNIYNNIDNIIHLLPGGSKCHIITSSSLVLDRSRFDIHYDDKYSVRQLKFVNFDKNVLTRRGRDCNFKLNINGAWYFINMDWIENNVCTQQSPDEQNDMFWNKSSMYTIIDNEQPSIDIDDENDMKQLLFMIKHFK